MRTIPAAIVLMAAIAAHAADPAPAEVAKRFVEKTYPFNSGVYQNHIFKYRLLEPPADAPKDQRYPLVLFLHGAGERGDDNVSQLKFLPTWLSEPEMRRKYPCYMLVPQCPVDRRWGSLDWTKKMTEYTVDEPDEMKYVEAIMQQTMKDYPIDASRVYLTGLSMGGYGSWELATRHPDWFAAVSPICGAGDTSRAAALTKLPLWAWHGDADKAVPVERSREMIEAIKKAGGSPKYTELPGVGHNSWTAAYTRPDGVVPWLFEQRK